ncbi:hypothetical protein EV426DRAFT_621587, partial [Tirmania nivea]
GNPWYPVTCFILLYWLSFSSLSPCPLPLWRLLVPSALLTRAAVSRPNGILNTAECPESRKSWRNAIIFQMQTMRV